jgi:hypothetical protein
MNELVPFGIIDDGRDEYIEEVIYAVSDFDQFLRK